MYFKGKQTKTNKNHNCVLTLLHSLSFHWFFTLHNPKQVDDCSSTEIPYTAITEESLDKKQNKTLLNHRVKYRTGSIQNITFCFQKVYFLLEHLCCCSSIGKMLIYIQKTGGSWHKSLAAIFSFIRLCSISHYRGVLWPSRHRLPNDLKGMSISFSVLF